MYVSSEGTCSAVLPSMHGGQQGAMKRVALPGMWISECRRGVCAPVPWHSRRLHPKPAQHGSAVTRCNISRPSVAFKDQDILATPKKLPTNSYQATFGLGDSTRRRRIAAQALARRFFFRTSRKPSQHDKSRSKQRDPRTCAKLCQWLRS